MAARSHLLRRRKRRQPCLAGHSFLSLRHMGCPHRRTWGRARARADSASIHRGMILFRQRKKLRLEFFVFVLLPLRFEEGAEQFRLDVAENPNDTEESIWCFLCEARVFGVDEARNALLEVGEDPRPVMREVYNMFKYGGDPEKTQEPKTK
ncbi:hypothetical protein HPP92_016320 [Vanilla planifolia]|uniref:Uncharacterized protein n=1 Tax=Vanilla planifolia TaxID=51239 RepID=A0A835UQD1_VANPL|nr:hypothetical protein HPP92_016320 [Vanilla planifolia]